LTLAAIGIYGVVTYTTRQRTREIGIRIALGAKPSDVFRLVLSQGLRLISVGMIIGLLLSIVLTRFFRGMLFGISETDVPTLAIVSMLLCLVALAACFVPARRVTKANLNTVIRYE
jgi:ABC-type antimicrobial peptide transport system permease subunit